MSEMNVNALKLFVPPCLFAATLSDFKSYDLLKLIFLSILGEKSQSFPTENKHVVVQSSTSLSIMDKSLAGVSLSFSKETTRLYHQPVVFSWCLRRPRCSPGRLRTRKIFY